MINVVRALAKGPENEVVSRTCVGREKINRDKGIEAVGVMHV